MDNILLYDISEPDLIQKCFNQNGVVAIKNILSKEELDNTIREIELVIQKNYNKNFSLNDFYTYNINDNDFNKTGVIGWNPLFTRQLLNNRLHPNIIKAFEFLYGNNVPLLCQHDRISWMRPTISPDNTEFSNYKTSYTEPNIHIDFDPVGYYNDSNVANDFLNTLKYDDMKDLLLENNSKHKSMGLQLQAVLNLFDNKKINGGFHCSLGGNNLLDEWFTKKNFTHSPKCYGKYNFNPKSVTDSIFSNTTHIECPPGTLILFDIRLPHGTRPNLSNSNRMVQFIRYIPKTLFNQETLERRKKLVKNILSANKYHIDPNIAKYLF